MRSKLFLVLVILALALSGPFGAGSAAAQNQAPTPAQITSGAGEYLLLFAIPQLGPEDAPLGNGKEEVERATARVIERQADQILPVLKSQITRGQISSMVVRPDRNGILLQVKDPAALAQLKGLPGVQGIYRSDKSVACSQWTVEDLKKAVVAQTYQPAGSSLAPQAFTATDPAIRVYHLGGYDWGYVYGTTTAGIPVWLKILRGGAVVGTGRTNANTDGSFNFYSSSGGCDTLTNWDLLDGDTVEVTAHGSVISTVVTGFVGWVDPGANKVGVTTAPNRSVKIDLTTSNSDPCITSTSSATVNSGASGTVEKSFSDFNRRAYATISVLDANGNSTYYSYDAYSFNVFEGADYFDFTWKPGETVTASLTHGGTIYTWTPWTLPNAGGFYYDLGTIGTLEAGDVLKVTSTLGSMSYTVVPFSMSQSPATDKISGTTSANRLVMARLYRNWYSTCTSSGCIKTNANGSGAYSISTPISQGDEVDTYSFDGEGNLQYGWWDRSAFLVAEPSYDDVGIYWPNTNPLTVIVWGSDNSLKEYLTGIQPPDSSYYTLWVYFNNSDLVAGDRIDVSDGTTTVYLTVQNLTARLNSSSSRLTGTAPNGHLKSQLTDFRRGQYWTQWICSEANVNGSFSLAFTNSQIGPQDYASAYLAGPDGNYTFGSGQAFKVILGLWATYVEGYTETPGASVIVTLKRDGSTLETVSVTSKSYLWYYANWSSNISMPNDVIEVTTSDGNSASLTLPYLSVAMDPVGNRLYGAAPAGQPLNISLWQTYMYNSWAGATLLTMASASGNFDVSTAGLLTINCNAVVAGSACTEGEADYYFPTNEHLVSAVVSNVTNLSTDAFESDQTYDIASTYAGIQHHTFAASDDVDWVKFTVTQSDVDAGVNLTAKTFNLGPNMDTVLELYAADGTTLLSSNDDYGSTFASQIVYKPTVAGTYYLKVLPSDSLYTRYCGAYYDLFLLVDRTHVYLPVTLK